MRQIGRLATESEANRFRSILMARRIRHELEADTDGSWALWIHDEDQIAAAQTLLDQFVANPNAAEFRNAHAEATRAQREQAKDLAEYRRRIQTRRRLFPKFGGYGVGILTYALVFTCGIVAWYSQLGGNEQVVRPLLISDPLSPPPQELLREVFAGEIWRLVTPIFIHFGPAHLIFNLIWLFQLGSMIEGRLGSFTLGLLVAGIAAGSNLAQYIVVHPVFGGMSGVVYGLAGYAWMRGKYDRGSGVFLDPQSLTILVIWQVLCSAHVIPNVANAAHIAGLLIGMAWGGLSVWLATRKPE